MHDYYVFNVLTFGYAVVDVFPPPPFAILYLFYQQKLSPGGQKGNERNGYPCIPEEEKRERGEERRREGMRTKLHMQSLFLFHVLSPSPTNLSVVSPVCFLCLVLFFSLLSCLSLDYFFIPPLLYHIKRITRPRLRIKNKNKIKD